MLTPWVAENSSISSSFIDTRCRCHAHLLPNGMQLLNLCSPILNFMKELHFTRYTYSCDGLSIFYDNMDLQANEGVGCEWELLSQQNTVTSQAMHMPGFFSQNGSLSIPLWIPFDSSLLPLLKVIFIIVPAFLIGQYL